VKGNETYIALFPFNKGSHDLGIAIAECALTKRFSSYFRVRSTYFSPTLAFLLHLQHHLVCIRKFCSASGIGLLGRSTLLCWRALIFLVGRCDRTTLLGRSKWTAAITSTILLLGSFRRTLPRSCLWSLARCSVGGVVLLTGNLLRSPLARGLGLGVTVAGLLNLDAGDSNILELSCDSSSLILALVSAIY
jgi:hypothetical protein